LPEVRVSIPAKPEYVHVLRSVAAGVAASLDLTFDDIEDLRLAVDEACAYLLAGGGEAGSLEARITSGGPSLEIVARLDGVSTNGRHTEAAHASVMWHILGALTDEARLEDIDGMPAIRLTKHITR
jgi:serine/threonine-protein kinase RsbW